MRAARADYRILISRNNCRPSAQLYPFSVRQRIPQFTTFGSRGELAKILIFYLTSQPSPLTSRSNPSVMSLFGCMTLHRSLV
ncbi:hypothetical protein C7B61_12335 [filamentous cyanobacterium CCP1]|nr:hypothetical protein C7B76_02480 [filamentous cyanobacterium CCP2]PSB64339.1 hypothetical protein C7B61_12335 [filamentous cyanobacterium CCP1]